MKLILRFLLLLIGANVFAQQYQLKGKVIDETSNQPLEFVNAILTQENNPYNGVITDSLGVFIIPVNEGIYQLSLEQFGETFLNKTITVSGDLDLGIFKIKSTKNIEEVVIKSKKKLIERKADRLVFNVQNSGAVTGGNVLDALKVTPRIQVKNEQISMIGKGSVTVMINDRLVQMSGEELSQYLKSLNVEDVKSIEVIPNPPAKYSAEGNSGLVNIVLKKSENDAWNAFLRSVYQQTTYPIGNVAGAYNMQKGKFQINTSVNYTKGSLATQESSKIYFSDFIWDKDNIRRDYYDVLSGRLGIEYKINDKLSMGGTYNASLSKPFIKSNVNTLLINSLTNALSSIMKTSAHNEYERTFNAFDYHFIYNMDDKNRKLSFDYNYFNYDHITDRKFSMQSFSANNQPLPNSLIGARNYGEQGIQNQSFNIDMEYPMEWVNLNYGGKMTFTKSDNLFHYYNIENGNEILDSNTSNQFNYKENTQALYFSAQKSFLEKWEVKAGVRYEFTQTEGFSQTLNQTNTNKYNKLFPTFYLAYTPNDNHSFSFNYGRRIQRPNFWVLNPFRYVTNPYSYSEGNPFLQPSFTDNIELGYSYKDFSITNVYFSLMDDVFEQAVLIDSITKIQRFIPLNFMVSKTFGVNQTFIFKPLKIWDVNATVDVFYSSTNSKIPQTLQFLGGWNGVFSISNDFALNEDKTLSANLNYSYTTKGVSNLDYNTAYSQLNMSVRWLLLDRKLVLGFYGNDILSSNRPEYTSYSNGIKTTFKNYYDNRYFGISLSYSFGKSFKTINRESKNQEEQNRLN